MDKVQKPSINEEIGGLTEQFILFREGELGDLYRSSVIAGRNIEVFDGLGFWLELRDTKMYKYFWWRSPLEDVHL
jgi:hypothetical protein